MPFKKIGQISFKVMKSQNQNYEKAIRPVFTDQVTNSLVIMLKYEVSYCLTCCSVKTAGKPEKKA